MPFSAEELAAVVAAADRIEPPASREPDLAELVAAADGVDDTDAPDDATG